MTEHLSPSVEQSSVVDKAFQFLSEGTYLRVWSKDLPRYVAEGWWVVADNPVGARDSEHYGVVPFDSVVARLWVRVRPMFRRS